MIDLVLGRLTRWLGLASSIAVMVITVAIVADVLGRSIWTTPLDGASEFAVSALIVVVYFGFAAAQRSDSNFRVDMLIRLLPPLAQDVLEVLWRLIAVAVIGLLAWLTSGEAVNSVEMLEASFGTIAFPVWPSRILLAVGMWMLAAQLLLEVVVRARNVGRHRAA